MHAHHEESIRSTIEHFQKDPQVRALLLCGSIAHGFETDASDVDVMLLVSDKHYEELAGQGRLAFVIKELCAYEGGYVDAKYVSLGYLRQVAEKGSEPARFAFEGTQVLFSHEDGLEQVLEQVVRYPVEGKADRLLSFSAQLEAWNWYTGEALKRNNRYVLWMAVSKLVLFGGRLILAHNEMLYPYHKWFLRVLETAKDQPPGLSQSIADLYEDPSADNIKQFYEMIKGFREWGDLGPDGWGSQFMKDSELNWQTDFTPVDDL